MKWYFSLSEASIDRPEHGWRDLIRVAVRSARLNTSLRPHMLYDGGENPFISEVRALGVTVIHRRVGFYEALARRGEGYLAIASGAFLRAEVPQIEHEDEFVLYTDCDVMFRADPRFEVRPRYFAGAPQTSRTDYLGDLNTGVMLMNVPALRADLPRFREFVIGNLDRGWPGCDQENYRRFYAGRWDPLDGRFNWKPYWGSDPEAVIVHWHGPKPMLVRKLLNKPDLVTDPHWRRLYEQAQHSYREMLAEWERVAVPSPPPPPRLVVDEATMRRIRGWAMDRADPCVPLFLRFLIDGALAWEGLCDQRRPDVRRAGHPSEQAGFDFDVPRGLARGGVLTICNHLGVRQLMQFGGQPRHELPLSAAAEALTDA